jgi:hypothetical protein
MSAKAVARGLRSRSPACGRTCQMLWPLMSQNLNAAILETMSAAVTQRGEFTVELKATHDARARISRGLSNGWTTVTERGDSRLNADYQRMRSCACIRRYPTSFGDLCSTPPGYDPPTPPTGLARLPASPHTEQSTPESHPTLHHPALHLPANHDFRPVFRVVVFLLGALRKALNHLDLGPWFKAFFICGFLCW